jgi:hypothetical protein
MDSTSMTLKTATTLQNVCIIVVYTFTKFKQVLVQQTSDQSEKLIMKAEYSNLQNVLTYDVDVLTCQQHELPHSTRDVKVPNKACR